MNIRSINWIVTIACTVAISGCSSLGLTLQTGAQLTKQTRALLECAPRSTYLPRELTKSVLPDHYLQPGDSILVEPVDFEERSVD